MRLDAPRFVHWDALQCCRPSRRWQCGRGSCDASRPTSPHRERLRSERLPPQRTATTSLQTCDSSATATGDSIGAIRAARMLRARRSGGRSCHSEDRAKCSGGDDDDSEVCRGQQMHGPGDKVLLACRRGLTMRSHFRPAFRSGRAVESDAIEVMSWQVH